MTKVGQTGADLSEEIAAIAQRYFNDGASSLTVSIDGDSLWGQGDASADHVETKVHVEQLICTVTAPPGAATEQSLSNDAWLILRFVELHARVAQSDEQMQTFLEFDLPATVDLQTTLAAVASQAVDALRASSVIVAVESDTIYAAGSNSDTVTDEEAASMLDDASATTQTVAARVLISLAIAEGRGVLSFIPAGEPPGEQLVHAIAQRAASVISGALNYRDSVDQVRIQNEYELAARVQSRLLPRREAPRLAAIETYAESRPARLVGGDFCAFVGGGDSSVFFAVGDVSGKGLPAAILMSMTLATLYNKVEYLPSPDPKQIIARANEDMYSNFTDVGMFATALVGMIDPEKQTVTIANCGHSPVVYKKLDQPAVLLEADGTPMGVLLETFAENRILEMEPGDVLVAASDGLNEQRNALGAMFGYDELLAAVEKFAHLPAEQLAVALFDLVRDFSDDEEQEDDQTLLVVRGVAPERVLMESRLPATLDALRELPNVLRAALENHRFELDPSVFTALELATHEACVNTVTHGYRGETGEIELKIVSTAKQISVEIMDDAQAFDPLRVPPPPLDEPQIHGYGIFLVQELMDEVTYEYAGGRNRLRLVKKL